jgi:hypothetical protein
MAISILGEYGKMQKLAWRILHVRLFYCILHVRKIVLAYSSNTIKLFKYFSRHIHLMHNEMRKRSPSQQSLTD